MDAINNKRAKAFIEEIIEVSKRHGLSIAHEDIGGDFFVYTYDERKTEWLRGFRLGFDPDRGVYRRVSLKPD